MKALKMEKRETFYMALSLPTQNYRRSPLVTLRHHEQENKKVINLVLVSLCLLNHLVLLVLSRSFSLSVYNSHSTVIVFCFWSLTFSLKSVTKILQEKKSKKFFSLSTNPLCSSCGSNQRSYQLSGWYGSNSRRFQK